MNDKKNIERFFQEKFKDFEANPEPMARDNISNRINKKKNKKRAFPIWFKSIGIAATLIIGCLLYILNNNNTNKILLKNNQNIIVAKPVIDNQNIKVDSAINVKNKSNKNKNNIVASADESIAKNSNASQNNNVVSKSNKNKNNIIASADESIAKNPNVSQNNNVVSKPNKNKNNIVASADDKKFKKSNQINKNKNSFELKIENQVAENASQKKSGKVKEVKNYQNNNNFEQKNNDKNEIVLNDKNIKEIQKINPAKTEDDNKVKNQFIKDEIENNKNNIAFNENKSQDKKSSENKSEVILDNSINKNKIAEIVIEKNNDIKPALTQVDLDRILKEKLEKTKKKVNENNIEKWTIRPNVAPIFMKAFTGSPIHDIFVDNEKDFENQISIGLAADYSISKKISIRAGINKFDLAYNTNDVAFYADPTLTTASLNTINFRPETQNLVVSDRKARGTSVGNIPQIAENGIINQSFGYLEFPVEVSYKLVDSKFGLTLITGLSTLLLNKNEVSLTSNSRKFVLGDANNLNNIHFSTNIGIGFKYKFWKSFEANVEPTLKYQIDTFSYDSGGFNPYFLGIYSGISYRL